MAFFFYFLLYLNFCASSTTGISIYSGTITGKIVLSLDGSMKDLFFVRLHTLILCPNFLDAQNGRDTELKKDATSYNHAEPAWTQCSFVHWVLLVMKVGMMNLYINYYRVLTLYFFVILQALSFEDSKMCSLCIKVISTTVSFLYFECFSKINKLNNAIFFI